MRKITLPVCKEYACDVLVAGGGVSGIAAAVSAARSGASVILCEADGVLGGCATQGLVGPFMSCYDKSAKTQIVRGFFDEFVCRMVKEGGAVHPKDCPGADGYAGYRLLRHRGVTPFSPDAFKFVAEAFCEEAGVKILYHARIIACDTQDSAIDCAYLSTVAGIEAVKAKLFIDTTGNATLAASAGARVFRDDTKDLFQTATMFFHIRGVDKEMLDKHMEKYTEQNERFFMDIFNKGIKTGEFPCNTRKLRIYESVNGIWTVNMAQEDSRIDDLDTEELTAAIISQRKQIPKIFKFLKENIPALKNIEMVTSANALGIRESRRIVGKTVITGDDVINSRYYDDRIAVIANGFDFHLQSGADYIPGAGKMNYYIPFGALVSENITNLFAAGKCVSADRNAFSAIRVMPPCFAMGEAVGIAAAIAAQNGCGADKVDVKLVQTEIIRRGGYLE